MNACLYVSICTAMCMPSIQARKGLGFPSTGVTNGDKMQCRCRELNQGLLE